MDYIVTNRNNDILHTGSQEECFRFRNESAEPKAYSWLIEPELPEVSYPHRTTAFYDEKTDTYYNRFGQQLRNPEEYNQHAEGYTPFGDE